MHLIEDRDIPGEGQDPGRKITTEDFYTWLGKLPEVMSITSAVCDDILGEEFDWFGSASAVDAAKRFSYGNHFRKKFYSALQDAVLIGDGYLGFKVPDLSDLTPVVQSMAKCDEKQALRILAKVRMRSPTAMYPRSLFVLSSPTITIDYDEHGVIRWYVQKVNGIARRVKFNPDEVIHLSINNIGHEVYGNSPFNSAINDMAVLWYAKDFAGKFFENDATIGRIYRLPKESPNSPNFKQFKKVIKRFEKMRNKHRALALTGEIELVETASTGKDLEFATLIDKFTQRLAMCWNMSLERLSETSNSSAVKNEGYYKKINRLSYEFEEVLNSELFSRFGNVRIGFRRAWKRDETREADIVTKLVGRPILSPNEGRTYIGQPVIEDDPKMDEVAVQFSQKPAGPMNESRLPEQNGNQNQTSADKSAKLEKRHTFELLTWDDFVKQVSLSRVPLNLAKIFFEMTNEGVTLYYSDGNNAYIYRMPNSEVIQRYRDFVVFRHEVISSATEVKLVRPGLEIRQVV